MKKNPMIMGTAVPNEIRSRNEDTFPGKKTRERVENRKAERPKPDMTIPVVVARWNGDDVHSGGYTEGTNSLSPPYPGRTSPSS